MYETVMSGLGLLASLDVVVALVLGILVGTIVGFLPGIGLLVGLSLALPFVVFLDPVVAFAFLLAMYAQATIAGDLTAIAFAVPGTPASAALVVDGHEMTKKGEVGKAFGAALTSSGLGAIIGLVPVLLLLPLVRPLVLALGSPEIFLLTLLGVAMIATVSGKSMLKGLAAGGIGFLIATFGPETQFGIVRFGFGNIYLLDGIPLVPLAVSIFAIPELLDLHSRRASIVRSGKLRARWSDMVSGMRAALANLVLVVRCSLIGLVVGFIPGLGGTTSQWIAYGHAVSFAKEPKAFGRGDVRGVVAPASANNSKDGGELLPTVAFAVPGSPPMALLLAALILLGVAPGPDMVGTNMHLTYFMLFCLVIANLAGVGVSAVGGRFLGRILGLKGAYMVPVILIFVFIGAGASSGRIGDIIVLLAIGALAWLMRIYGWPVAPLVLAVVLGDRAEQTLWRTIAAYGWTWLWHPTIIVLFIITGLLIAMPFWMWRRERRQAAERAGGPETTPVTDLISGGSVAFAIGTALFGVFVMVVPLVMGWPTAAIVFPIAFGAITALLGLAVGARDLYRLLWKRRTPTRAKEAAATAAGTDLSVREITARRRLMMVALLGLGVAVWLLGTSLAMALFVALYLRVEGRVRNSVAAVAGVLVFVSCYIGLVGALGVSLPGGILTGLPA
ncbi:MAG: hypothetical protein GEU28_14005 [Dehalococcoidia bacterium]|nr:hypothetical protein [Dehalococcoidia bacterium]